MNQTIAERQRSPESQRLFKAFSWHYTRAKIWRALFGLGTIGLAGASPVLVLWHPEFSKWLAVLAGVWLPAGRFGMRWFERQHRTRGAKIQDKFDRDLFSLEWNCAVAGPPPAEEDITDAALRFCGDSARVNDWYPDTRDAARPIDVLLCQRSSAVWGRRDHYAYAQLLIVVAAIWFLGGVALAVVQGLPLEAYLLFLLFPSEPAFVETVDLIQFHLRQGQSKENIERELNELLNRAANGRVVREGKIDMVQQQLFQFRRDGVYVPTFFYRLRRTRGQVGMQEAVDKYLARMQRKQ